ncbi:MAG: hypothetical protein PGN09_13650 [Sphingomonas fennica]
MTNTARLLPLAALALLGACAKDQFDETGGVRITRSTCPAVAIPAYTGDVTLFSPAQSRDLRALDATATLTDVSVACQEGGETIQATASFTVLARRSSASGARQLTLPYFATVMRGGTRIMSKQVGQVTVDFADGQVRGQARGQATASIARALAALPAPIQDKVTRRRKPSDADAAIDPMTDPAVRAAVTDASFELLIGFQLNESQLAYNATR